MTPEQIADEIVRGTALGIPPEDRVAEAAALRDAIATALREARNAGIGEALNALRSMNVRIADTDMHQRCLATLTSLIALKHKDGQP